MSYSKDLISGVMPTGFHVKVQLPTGDTSIILIEDIELTSFADIIAKLEKKREIGRAHV